MYHVANKTDVKDMTTKDDTGPARRSIEFAVSLSEKNPKAARAQMRNAWEWVEEFEGDPEEADDLRMTWKGAMNLIQQRCEEED